MIQLTLEDRLATLEREVDQLKRRLDTSAGRGQGSNANWLDAVTGSMAGDPDFQEVLRLGRAPRQADRPADAGHVGPGEPPA